MRKHFANICIAIVFIFGIAAPVMSLTSPQTVSAAACESRVLGIPPWYRGLTKENPPACDMQAMGEGAGKVEAKKYIWTIVLNVVEMAIVIVAYIAVFFILYGGFLFMTGGSNPGQIEKARKTILNAVIGLVIAMAAIGINNLVFSII